MTSLDPELHDSLEALWDQAWDTLRLLSPVLGKPLPTGTDEVAPPPVSDPIPPGRQMTKEQAMEERRAQRQAEKIAAAKGMV